jgi:hypothetical protein
MMGLWLPWLAGALALAVIVRDVRREFGIGYALARALDVFVMTVAEYVFNYGVSVADVRAQRRVMTISCWTWVSQTWFAAKLRFLLSKVQAGHSYSAALADAERAVNTLVYVLPSLLKKDQYAILDVLRGLEP